MRDSMNQNCTLFKKEISSGDMMIYDHLGTWWVFFDFMSWQNELEDKEEGGSLGLPGCFVFSAEGVSERKLVTLLPRKKLARTWRSRSRVVHWCRWDQGCPQGVLQLLQVAAQLVDLAQGCTWTWDPCCRWSRRFAPVTIVMMVMIQIFVFSLN